MATVVVDYETVHVGYVESVTVVETDSPAYPSGWKYSLHYGSLDGKTLSGTTTHTNARGVTTATPRTAYRPQRFPGWQRSTTGSRPKSRNSLRDRRVTTLHVTVGEGDQIEERARRRIGAAEAGEDLSDAQPVLNVESYADLARLFSKTNLELIEAIARVDPASMRETADHVDRDFKEVHRNLTELETLGVIELRPEGRSKRPVVPFDDIEVAIDLVDRGDDGVGERPANA